MAFVNVPRLIVFILLCSTPRHASSSGTGRYSISKGVNGGYRCLACTAIVALTEQISVIHNETFVNSYDRLCHFLPELYRNACIALGKFYIPTIIDLLTDEVSADVVCHAISLCYEEKGQPRCHAFPPRGDFREQVSQSRKMVFSKVFDENESFKKSKGPETFDPCTLVGVKELCHLFVRVFADDLPLIDLDNDSYSVLESWRGSSWRGRDCDDVNSSYHPGAKPVDSDIIYDSNCNGIYGSHHSGMPFENVFCKDTGYLGVIVLGDSVAAHFHIPPAWVTAALLTSEKIFRNAAFIVENEFDWPQLSLYSGYLRKSRWPMEWGHSDSIYLKLWRRNHCNHRDYQNLAKNGADSFEANSKILPSMARNQTLDQPALVFYSFIGNDVCHSKPSLDSMTTPKEMHENVLETLHSLDKRLPKGSHVILIGLVDGRVLYDSLHNRIHPIGQLRGDVTYEKLYDFLNCLQISPCYGWLNSNETIRNETSERAAQLTAVLSVVADTYKFENLDVYFLECPIQQVLKEWEEIGGKIYQLIEPVDGFHPTMEAEALAANVLWQNLETRIPHVLGKLNPNNFLIESIFGNQGGY